MPFPFFSCRGSAEQLSLPETDRITILKTNTGTGTRYIHIHEPLHIMQEFYGRKHDYGIETLVLADDNKLIRALDVDSPGSAHDARIWRTSLFKPIIEEQRDFMVAGDSAFPIDEVLIKPYSNQEAVNNARRHGCSFF